MLSMQTVTEGLTTTPARPVANHILAAAVKKQIPRSARNGASEVDCERGKRNDQRREPKTGN
jgi:hypothetical protein